MKRKVALFLYYSFFQFLPHSRTPFLGRCAKNIRQFLVKIIFKKAGRNISIEPNAYFGTGKEITIGDYSGIGERCRVPNNIKIGNYVMMAADVVILGDNHEFKDISIPMLHQGRTDKTKLTIEDDVWLGTRSIITSSVSHIGCGAIVAAGAVVTKNVAPYAVVAGNPARELYKRKA